MSFMHYECLTVKLLIAFLSLLFQEPERNQIRGHPEAVKDKDKGIKVLRTSP